MYIGKKCINPIAGTCLLAAFLICAAVFIVKSGRFSKPVQATPAPPKLLIAREDLSLESLTRVLGLSESQVKRIKPILKTEGKRRAAIIRTYAGPDGNLDETGLRQLQDYSAYYEKMYSHILDEKQFAEFIRIRNQLRGQ